MELRELEGDHTAAERAELHDGEVDTMWRPLHDGVTWPAGAVSVPGLPF